MVNRKRTQPDPEPLRARLLALFHHRWAAPILAELHRGDGAKFVTLVKRLEAPRDSINKTLQALTAGGWATRNPGHGHPLRPEWILTADGEQPARVCVDLVAELEHLELTGPGLKKWSMPAVLALATGPRRFAQLQALLPGVTHRALTLTLKELVDAALVSRRVGDGYPPSVTYELQESTAALRRILLALKAQT